MDKNSIVVAPQFANIEAAYAEWHKRYSGDKETFYRFMTIPSVEREGFIRGLDIAGSGILVGDVAEMCKTEIL